MPDSMPDAAPPTQPDERSFTAVLADADVVGIVRLLGEVIAHPGDLPARKRHLLDGLAAMVRADGWTWLQTRGLPPEEWPAPFSALDGGWADPRQRAHVMGSMNHPEVQRLANARSMAASLAASADGRSMAYVTRSRRQMVSDAEWEQSPLSRDRRANGGIDDFLLVLYPLGGDAVSAISMHRGAGAEAFGPRERCLCHLVLGEVDWLHRAGSDVPGADRVLGLTPRQREVLLMLLGGDSRKQIAAKLGLSTDTVGDHMKALHRHFEVGSRGALMALFVGGGRAVGVAVGSRRIDRGTPDTGGLRGGRIAGQMMHLQD